MAASGAGSAVRPDPRVRTGYDRAMACTIPTPPRRSSRLRPAAGIVFHAGGVARVAAGAAAELVAAGIPVDAGLVAVAALLHDIDKLETRAPQPHGIVGARWLTELGYPELAVPVASHPISSLLNDERFPIGWPSVLVSIADQHVTDRFVTIDERIDDLLDRHPADAR